MENKDLNYTILRNCYKNAQMAILSLNEVIEIATGSLKQTLISQREGYNMLIAKMSEVANELNIELPTVNEFQKGMLTASINIKTITDDSNSHIAEMTLKGTIMGLTELIRDISDYAPILKPQVLSCVEEVKDFEEKCEAELKKHL